MVSDGATRNGDSPAVLEAGEWRRDALHNLCLADPVWAERYDGWTELGSGGTATVVFTHSRAAGELVALKIFPRLAPEDRERFQQEVRNAQRLASPHIVRTFSPFLRGSLAWIEMEYVDGPSLREDLERRSREGTPFTKEQAFGIGVALAQALAAAHEAGVIHRDVKPANVLLPRSGSPRAKLGDFGTSRVAGAARLTKTGLLVGTPQFAAPEVVEGQPAGPASDVYSLSLCLYLLFTNNRFPYLVPDESSPAQWLKAHTDQAALPATALNPEVPPELAGLLARGLAKLPQDRPSASEVLDGLTALTKPVGVGVRRARRPRSPRLALVGLAILALVIAIAGIRRPPAPEPAVPSDPRPSVAPPPETPSAPTPTASRIPTRPPRILPLPSARPEPTPLPLRATLRGDLLLLQNFGGEPFTDLRIALVSADGGRHAATAPEGLTPGEELFLALDSFEPTPPAGFVPVRVDVAARGVAGDPRVTSIPVP